MNKQNLLILFFIILISGCEQNKTTNSSITIFEKYPNWTYLFCKPYSLKNDSYINLGALLVIEPEKNTPLIYAWQYKYDLDLTWGGTSDIESKVIFEKSPYSIRSHIEDHPNKFEPNFKLSSFFKNTSKYCGSESSKAKDCKFFTIMANPTASYEDHQYLYLNRTNLFLDRTARYTEPGENFVRNPDKVCSVVDINSNKFNEIEKSIKVNYEKAVKYHQYIIDQHNANKKEFKI